MGEFEYRYKPGMRVGLVALVTDVHDKGNIALKIEGTEEHLCLSEAALLGGVDLVHARLRERHEVEAAAAFKAEAAEALRMKVDREAMEAAESANEPRDLGAPGTDEHGDPDRG